MENKKRKHNEVTPLFKKQKYNERNDLRNFLETLLLRDIIGIVWDYKRPFGTPCQRLIWPQWRCPDTILTFREIHRILHEKYPFFFAVSEETNAKDLPFVAEAFDILPKQVKLAHFLILSASVPTSKLVPDLFNQFGTFFFTFWRLMEAVINTSENVLFCIYEFFEIIRLHNKIKNYILDNTLILVALFETSREFLLWHQEMDILFINYPEDMFHSIPFAKMVNISEQNIIVPMMLEPTFLCIEELKQANLTLETDEGKILSTEISDKYCHYDDGNCSVRNPEILLQAHFKLHSQSPVARMLTSERIKKLQETFTEYFIYFYNK